MKDHTYRAPQDKVCGYEYTVRRGDSFYIIANRLGIPLRDLLEANSDINPARLMVGDVLCIPMEEEDAPPKGLTPPEDTLPPEAPSPAEVPTPTETPLSQLPTVPEMPAESESLPEVLPDENENLDTPAIMPEGPVNEEMLVCPEANRYTIAQDESVTDVQLLTNANRYTLQNANPSTDLDQLAAGQMLCIPPENTSCPTPSTYTLQQDDTLESTALRLNTSLAALLRANPCLAPSDFVTGACIFVP